MFEYTNQYKEALERWASLRSNEGCERTIEILKKAGSKEWIEHYSQWVFEKDPEIGLKLFTSDKNTEAEKTARGSLVGSGQSVAGMPVDEVLAFLEKLQEGPTQDPRGGRYVDSRLKGAVGALKDFPLI